MSEKIKEIFCQVNYERVLLAYCFQSIENYYVISSSISDSDFLRPEHRLMWVIMGTLVKNNVKNFDGAMVINEAQRNGVFEDIGKYEYVQAVIGMNTFDENLQFYIDKVIDASTKYQLYMKLDKGLKLISHDAANNDVTSSDMLGMVGTDVMELSVKSKAIREATNLADGLDDYIKERKENPIEYCGISTGYDILDKRIDGMVPGTLTVLCARPKHGKSTFLSCVAKHVAYIIGKPVLYVDTEMPFDQWRSRMLSMMSDVPERIVKHGGYSEEQYYNISQAAEIIKRGKLFHEYMPGYSVDKLAAVYRKYKHVEDIGLAIFDYIKEPPGGSKERKEYQILGDVTTALKDLSGELDIPFLCANQLNRQQDIADSDRILRYADVLMFFKTKTPEEIEAGGGLNGGTHKLVITDSRRGGTTTEDGIGYEFLKKTLQIHEAEFQVVDYNKKDYQEKEDIEYGVSTGSEWDDEAENFLTE